MSSVLYGTMLRKRRMAVRGTSRESKPPGVITPADSLAALVPSEVLVLHAYVVSEYVDKVSKRAGQPVTKFDEPGQVKLWFGFLLLLSVGLCLVGLMKFRPVDKYDWGSLAIPPFAFFLWTILQEPSALDAFSLDFLDRSRIPVVLIGFAALTLAASALGYQVDEKTGPTTPERT